MFPKKNQKTYAVRKKIKLSEKRDYAKYRIDNFNDKGLRPTNISSFLVFFLKILYLGKGFLEKNNVQ